MDKLFQKIIKMKQKVINTNKSTNDVVDKKNYLEQDKINEVGNQNEIYIFESPDKGKTIYRRPFGAPHNKREILTHE